LSSYPTHSIFYKLFYPAVNPDGPDLVPIGGGEGKQGQLPPPAAAAGGGGGGDGDV